MSRLAFNIQPAQTYWTWTETIYIRTDGRVTPDTAPISTVDNVTYTFTDHIVGDVPDHTCAIIVERDNIVVDGSGYSLQGVNAWGSNGTALFGRSNVTIKNMVIKSFCAGIQLASSNYSSVFGNKMMDNKNGIFLTNSSHNMISGNYLIRNWWAGILFRRSESNIISGNNITEGYGRGIQFELDGIANRLNIISGNNITNNWLGIYLYSSSNNEIYHNNFINNTQQAWTHLTLSTWDDGYPSGGNYWSDHVGIDNYSGINQSEPGSDGITDEPYIIDSNNQDNYPIKGKAVIIESNVTISQVIATGNTLQFDVAGPTGEIGWINASFPMVNKTDIGVFVDGVELTPPPFPIITANETYYFIYFEFDLSIHEINIQYAVADLAITDVTLSKSVVGEAYPLNISVAVQNQGNNTETFNVTAYYNETAMILPSGKNHTTVTLSSGNSTTINYTWNTTGVARGNYTISAYAIPISFETDTDDNSCVDGTVLVTITGDITGDGVVDIYDLNKVGKAYGSWAGGLHYSPEADISDDGHVDIRDVIVVCTNYGKTAS